MRVLLVSTYELGHQPWHLATAAAALRAAGHDIRALDLAVDPWDDAAAGWAERVAFAVPMHTAARLARDAVEGLRADHPDVPVCFYGLYAAAGADLVDTTIAGEYERALVDWVEGPVRGARLELGRHSFPLPARDLLPPLDRYARLSVAGEERLAGYVEASRGCAHRCTHCPVPVVYDGRIRIVAEASVVEDVTQLVGMGARHITFGDPDFLNGAHHSMRVVRKVHQRFPDLTFDCTVKVEHVLRHRDLWREMAASGCLFVVSAVETLNDDILRRLDKGHTADDAAAAVELLRGHGIETRPSFLPFTPWTTPADVADIVRFVVEHDLVANVDPVQYTIRLLIPEGSLVLRDPDVRARLGPYDPARLAYPWEAVDPAVDELQRHLARLVEEAVAAGATTEASFRSVAERVGVDLPAGLVVADDRPRLTEPWFCCAEPTAGQLESMR